MRIGPHNLGFGHLSYTVIHHTPFASSLWQRDRHVRCEGEPRGVDVGTRFFKDTREQCMGTFVDSRQCGGGGDDIGSGVSTEDDVSLQICDEPRPVAVFLKAVIVSVFGRRSALHDQRRAVATACRSSTLVIFLQRDQQKLTTATAKYLCPEPVTASSATVRSSTWNLSRLARSKMASTFPAAATTPFPSATFAHSCATCVVETQHLRLGKSRPAPKPLMAAQRQNEIRFPSSVTSIVVHEAK